MSIVLYLIAALVAVDAALMILKTGKPRGPVTPVDAALTAVIAILVIAALTVAAGRLS